MPIDFFNIVVRRRLAIKHCSSGAATPELTELWTAARAPAEGSPSCSAQSIIVARSVRSRFVKAII